MNELRGKYFNATQAAPNDVLWISSNMRQEDRLEIERFYEESPCDVLRFSFEQSVMSWTAYRPDGLPVAMWGVAKAPDKPHVGIPWMIGTDYIAECYRDFVSFSRHFDITMSRYFHVLVNAVDVEYAGARRWLKWLGYQEGNTIKSIKNYDFVVMYKDTSNVR
jgi:hypothetical protein